ncbi:MAG: ASCH domain-containing protein [Candidatus Binatia bacterium]|jgi:hypothetical protein
MKALLVRRPWIDLILAGEKTWELRGSRTSTRGRIALVQSGTGTVVGTCDIVDVVGPLSSSELRRNAALHRVPAAQLGNNPYTQTFAWIFSNAKALRKPVCYRHRPGAVIWVRLSSSVAAKVRPANRPLHPTGTARPPRKTRTPRRGARG